MTDKKPKIMVFMLSRTGCIPYATKMVNTLVEYDKFIFVSSFSPEQLPKDNHKIITYRNRLEFVISTVLILPFLLLSIVYLILFKNYKKAYFPVFHHWNPFIIQICKWLNVEIIFTVHDGILHIGEQRVWEQKLLNYCIRKAEKLIFLSNHVESITKKQIGFTAKSALIPHPILKLNKKPIRKRQLPANPGILFLGRIVEYKGVDLLIEAVEDVREVELGRITIAGRDYSGKYPPENSNGKINWIGRWLAENEMLELIEQHDILVLPYREASQSGVLTMGIAQAIPMICTKVGGLMEQLTSEEALFVEPSVKDIKSGIVKLGTDQVLYEKIHANLLKKATSENESLGLLLNEFIGN